MNMYRVINNVKRRRRFRGEERDRDALLRTRRALPRAIRRQYPRNRTPKLRSATRSDQRRSRVAPHPPPSANPSGRRPRTLRRSRPSPARRRRESAAANLRVASHRHAAHRHAAHRHATHRHAAHRHAAHLRATHRAHPRHPVRVHPETSPLHRVLRLRVRRASHHPPLRAETRDRLHVRHAPHRRVGRRRGVQPVQVHLRWHRAPPARRARRRRPSPEAAPPPVRPG